MSEYKCCNEPSYKRAYIVFKIFKAKYCVNCGEVTMDCSPVLEWIFMHIFAHFWFGTVTVTNKEVK